METIQANSPTGPHPLSWTPAWRVMVTMHSNMLGQTLFTRHTSLAVEDVFIGCFMVIFLPELCGFCRKTVALAEPAIEALNRTYHDSCFQCRQCQTPLAGKLYYNKAGIPLCEECYQVRITYHIVVTRQ